MTLNWIYFAFIVERMSKIYILCVYKYLETVWAAYDDSEDGNVGKTTFVYQNLHTTNWSNRLVACKVTIGQWQVPFTGLKHL